MLFDFIFSKKSQGPNWPATDSVIHAQISQPQPRQRMDHANMVYATVMLGQAILDGNQRQIRRQIVKHFENEGLSHNQAMMVTWRILHQAAPKFAELMAKKHIVIAAALSIKTGQVTLN